MTGKLYALTEAKLNSKTYAKTLCSETQVSTDKSTPMANRAICP